MIFFKTASWIWTEFSVKMLTNSYGSDLILVVNLLIVTRTSHEVKIALHQIPQKRLQKNLDVTQITGLFRTDVF
jgi:hypothetical protein